MRRPGKLALLVSLTLSLPATAFSSSDPAANTTALPVADTVYRNAYVYTVDAFNSVAQAVAIKDGKFIAVGTDDAIQPYIGKDSNVTDLRGKMIMPGIVDMHIHPLRGALAKFNFCSFDASLALDEMLEYVQGCIGDKNPGEWIQGSKWNSNWVGSIDKSVLDAIAPENPLYLIDDTNHIAWVNSQAVAAH